MCHVTSRLPNYMLGVDLQYLKPARCSNGKKSGQPSVGLVFNLIGRWVHFELLMGFQLTLPHLSQLLNMIWFNYKGFTMNIFLAFFQANVLTNAIFLSVDAPSFSSATCSSIYATTTLRWNVPRTGPSTATFAEKVSQQNQVSGLIRRR